VPWRQETSIAGIKLANTESNHYFFPRIVSIPSRVNGVAKAIPQLNDNTSLAVSGSIAKMDRQSMTPDSSCFLLIWQK
jgi:hypothetical protein